MKKICMVFFVFTLIGCVPKPVGPIYSTPDSLQDGYSRIFIYRLHHYTNSAIAPVVHINGVPRYQIRNQGYQYYDVKPGKYELLVNHPPLSLMGSSKIEIEVKENETKYILFSYGLRAMNFSGGVAVPSYNVGFAEVAKEQGEQQIKSTYESF